MTHEYDRFESEDRGGSFLMGLLAGTVLGAGLGMLFAPRSGSELRHQLSDSASRLQRTATEKYQEASEKMGDMVNRGRDTYEQIVNKGRDAMEKGREAYEEAAGRADDTYTGREPRTATTSYPGTPGV